LDLFPQQANGFPKQDFGNACWGGSVYYGPGNDHSKDTLYTQCPTVQEDIPYCQAKGKKIVLSLGGGTSGYQLTGVAAGVDFANFLWKAYGPKQAGYTGVRPLDRGYSNTTSDTIDIAGFDFDIEHPSIGT
jgi:chitinase